MSSIRSIAHDDDAGLEALASLRTAWALEDSAPSDEPWAAGRTDASSDSFTASFIAWARTSGRTLFLAADDEGAAHGMCNVAVFHRMPKPGSSPSCWAYLANVYVLPQHRGTGLGGLLIDAAVQYARGIGAVRLVTAPSERSRPLYGRHGFAGADELMVRPIA